VSVPCGSPAVLSKDFGEKSDLAAEFAEKKTELAKMWEPWESHNIAPR